ncbi:hypothetical protein FBY13_11250 [Pantoea sp. SJZ147]|nr:hypothetical protein FBY13_11250 [Pantoea sp. SJZ147]
MINYFNAISLSSCPLNFLERLKPQTLLQSMFSIEFKIQNLTYDRFVVKILRSWLINDPCQINISAHYISHSNSG